MWNEYYSVASMAEAVQILDEHGSRARIIAGATDLILELERGVRKGIDVLVDVSRVPGQNQVTIDEDEIIHIGPLVTHNHCVASPLIVERAFPLAAACWEVGAPQIRNRGTLAGNLITASPANDTITPLMALDASVTLLSKDGERQVSLREFYTGVRRTAMRPEEVLIDISFPALRSNQRGGFLKLGLRRAQAISIVDCAVILTLNRGRIESAAITLGSVAPTIVHAPAAEEYLRGKELDEVVMEEAGRLAQASVTPIDDVRSSADYRKEMVRVCVLRTLRSLAQGEEKSNFPDQPVLLWGKAEPGEVARPVSMHWTGRDDAADQPIVTNINGQEYTFSQGQQKTLLRLLREEAGLIGTKEGCAEGECGACTVFLDGVAVMACMVPAPRAHMAKIVTVEGLVQPDGELHPVQQAFIDEGAVQCGYCTPGFLMSAAKLLEEKPQPSKAEIQQAITGNLCRCTGYYKIIEAIEDAALVNA